jgi:peroxiredoxin
MTIKPGDRLPNVDFFVMTAEGKQSMAMDVIFGGRKVVLFAVPGAFTPGCTKTHLPGFVREAAAIKAKGVDTIACTSVNDIHVMTAWAEAGGATGRILMLADGNATFARAVGLNADKTADGMGERSLRYAMIVEDCVVKVLNVEPKPGINVSSAETILSLL